MNRLLALIVIGVLVLTVVIAAVAQSASMSRRAGGGDDGSKLVVTDVRLAVKNSQAIWAAAEVQSSGDVVQNATVRAQLSLPDGRTTWLGGRTNGNGHFIKEVKFAGPGVYELTVVDVTKQGMTFDKANSKVLDATLQIGGNPQPDPPATATETETETATATETETDEDNPDDPTETPVPPTATEAEPTETSVDPPNPPNPPEPPHDGNDTWHAPTDHEHGDAPPQWVTNAGYTPTFTHVAGTPGENHAHHKHTAFKGWSLTMKGVEVYGIFHLDFNPGGHGSRFHSYQVWALDPSGGVSHWHGWFDFGTGNMTGPQFRTTCQPLDVRPIMQANREGCPIVFENWYSRAGGSGGWSWDVGININSNYYNQGDEDPMDPSTWTAIDGNVRNTHRRIEMAWYDDRSSIRGSFWTTQFGDYVTGPNDSVCGSQRSYGDRSYTVICLEQFIAPTMQTVAFPGNSDQKKFPSGSQLELPN